MFKRIVFIIISLALVLSITSGSAEFLYGPKYRASSNLNNVFIDETLSDHHFKYLETFASERKEQLGYMPNYEVDYEREVVTFWLYNSVVEVKCVLVDEDNKVIIPDVPFDESLVRYNALYSALINRAYRLSELDSKDYSIDKIVGENGMLKVFIYSTIDDKYIELSVHEYTIHDDDYFISPNEFRQLWFEIYGLKK